MTDNIKKKKWNRMPSSHHLSLSPGPSRSQPLPVRSNCHSAQHVPLWSIGGGGGGETRGGFLYDHTARAFKTITPPLSSFSYHCAMQFKPAYLHSFCVFCIYFVLGFFCCLQCAGGCGCTLVDIA